MQKEDTSNRNYQEGTQKTWDLFTYLFFKKYIVLIMLLQLSHFFLPFIPPRPPPLLPLALPSLVHAHGLYI